MKLVIYVLIFLAGLLCVEAVYLILRDLKQQRLMRVKNRMAPPRREDGGAPPVFLRKADVGLRAALRRYLIEQPLLSRIPGLLEKANVPLRSDQFLILSLGLFVFVGFASALFTRHIAATLLLALIGFFVPLFYVLQRKHRRQVMIQEQFPEVLDLIVRSLRAGHALTGTFRLVAEEFSYPLGLEFKRIYDENNLGLSLRDSLKSMEQRLESFDMKFFVTSVLIQRETGGNLTEILEGLSRTIRNRLRLQGQIRAKTSEGRLSGWILGLLPVIMGGVLSFINPGHVRILWEHPQGQKLLGLAIAMVIVGGLLIKKIVSIKV